MLAIWNTQQGQSLELWTGCWWAKFRVFFCSFCQRGATKLVCATVKKLCQAGTFVCKGWHQLCQSFVFTISVNWMKVEQEDKNVDRKIASFEFSLLYLSDCKFGQTEVLCIDNMQIGPTYYEMSLLSCKEFETDGWPYRGKFHRWKPTS